METETCGGRARCTSCSSSHADWPIHAPVVINICTCKRVLQQGKFGTRFSPASESGRAREFVQVHDRVVGSPSAFAKPANTYSCTFGGTVRVLGHWAEWWPPSPCFRCAVLKRMTTGSRAAHLLMRTITACLRESGRAGCQQKQAVNFLCMRQAVNP